MSFPHVHHYTNSWARFSLAASIAIILLTPSSPVMAQYNVGDYGYYIDQASNYFNNNETTKAIDMFKKAVPLAGDENLTTTYNNLAAAYIKRGIYFHNNQHNYNSALSDYRNALFYLEYAWPDNTDRSPTNKKNMTVTQQNLQNIYQALRLNPNDTAMHLAQAKQLRLNGALQESIVEYGQALKLDPKNAEASKALGDLYNVINMPLKSQKYYQTAGDLLGANAGDELFVQQGNAAFKGGNIDQAVKLYNRALEVNPKNMNALNQLEKIWLNEIKFNNASVLGHANLASVYQKKKMYEQALQQYNAADHFSEMNRTTPFEVKKLIRLNLGTLYQENQQYEMANAAYDTVLKTDPNNILALTYKASLLKDVGRQGDALAVYQKILTLDPNNAFAQQALFGLATDQKDPAKAGQALRDYASRMPNNAEAQAKVGEEFHRMKDYDSAEEFYRRALQLNPNLAEAYANLGAVYQAQGKNQQSLDAYQQALKLDPSNKTVKDLLTQTQSAMNAEVFQQAVALQQAGKHTEALPAFRQALSQTPNNADLIAAYGISLQNSNQQDEAIRQYQKAIALKPNNANFHYYLATAYHQKNQIPLATQSYKKALQLDPSLADAKDALAALGQQQSGQALQKAIDAYNGKRYPQALTAVNEALASNANDAMAHYYKGLILQAQNNALGAKNSYKEATRLNPDFADAYYALGVILETQSDKIGAKNAFRRFVELSTEKDDEFVQYAQERLKVL